MREKALTLVQRLQSEISRALEEVDGEKKFVDDAWTRVDKSGGHGGGGLTKVMRNGRIFESAGVNVSEVHGVLPPAMSQKLIGEERDASFYATGVSLVLHPQSPMVPTTHANFRYLEVEAYSWFGGGADLTPYYLWEEDAVHFHRTFKKACDAFDPDYYPDFKKRCDEYFYLPHRGEARGIGGIFFDYLGKDDASKLPEIYSFVEQAGEAFIDSYLPIVHLRSDEPWEDSHRQFQLMRRGRYVEFNLLYDRGTTFGLKTNGRTESILMSLPPNVSWEYNYQASPGSPEEKLVQTLSQPRDWV
jgi:coproporphyrinogen III oxidase